MFMFPRDSYRVIMHGLFERRGTIIAHGLKVVGSVTAQGPVEVNGGVDRATKPAPISHRATSGLPTRGDRQLAP
jgi:hypothetical protein